MWEGERQRQTERHRERETDRQRQRECGQRSVVIACQSEEYDDMDT